MPIISTKKIVPQVVKQVKRLKDAYNNIITIKEQIYISYEHATYELLKWCDKYKYDYRKVMDLTFYEDLENVFWKELENEKNAK